MPKPTALTPSGSGDGRYPRIEDYAFIGDCHSAALVSSQGSIDWCCMPRMDRGSTFGRLLDWDKGGYCQIAPAEPAESRRSYLADTMILETVFRTPSGSARVLDCFTTRPGGAARPHRQLLRVVEGIEGQVELAAAISVRFDYGGVQPWLRQHARRTWTAVGGDDAVVLSGDLELEAVGAHDLSARVVAAAGTRARLSITAYRPEQIDPAPPDQPAASELDRRLEATAEWWRAWSAQTRFAGPGRTQVSRSALVLKALTNAPTGAIAAAPTTSLPEAIGADRNWDYRYSWIRDSQFTVRSLGELGHDSEADGFRRFIERTAAGSPEEIQIMYGLGGERRLVELTLPLQGYRSSQPVRVGNGASTQLQLDVFGELLDLAWQWHGRGRSPDSDYWRFLGSLVETASARWHEPDRGLWEVRGEPLHFVHSKVMCWVAVDRGIRLAEDCGHDAPLDRWRQTRDEIRHSVDTEGMDAQRGIYVRSYGSTELDAALLLLPTVDFVAYDDPRMVATTDAVAADLDHGGLLRRYRAEDGLGGEEGVFVACTFWLAECLARQKRMTEAQSVFDRAVRTANDLGLYSEEFDPRRGTALGNFPQGLTHLSHIAAAVALAGGDQPG